MKVVCINSEAWANEETGIKERGPEFNQDYTVLDQEDEYYELLEFPGVLFPKEEFVTTVEWTEKESRVLDKIFSR